MPVKKGYKHSLERNKKISMALKGRPKSIDHTRKMVETRKKNGNYVAYNKGKKGLYKASEETKNKMSISQTGRKHTEETRKKIGESNKGKHSNYTSSEETRMKISLKLKGRKFSTEHKSKLSEAQKGEKSHMWGKKLKDETKIKLSDYHKNNPIRYWLGRKMPEEMRKKMGEARKGEKNPAWLGGKSFELYGFEWTKLLKHSIRTRDCFICKICKKNGYVVHHIDYDKKNCNPDNLITLCNSCHAKTNKNRDYWINFFKNEN